MDKYQHRQNFDQKIDALRTRIKDLDQLKVRDDVFDENTLLALYKFITRKWISAMGGPISTGKEANVFIGNKDGTPVAIKIYLMRTANFQKMQDYIAGDRRFQNIGKGKKDIIFAWTRKEYSNLKRAEESAIRVPKPLAFDRNILLMEFIGEGEIPAPQLRVADISDPGRVYETLTGMIRNLWIKANLVHGDLSEYNILYHQEQPYIIDMGQAVTRDHPHAHGFLKRDLENTNRFFSSLCTTREVDELLGWITGHSPSGGPAPAMEY